MQQPTGIIIDQATGALRAHYADGRTTERPLTHPHVAALLSSLERPLIPNQSVLYLIYLTASGVQSVSRLEQPISTDAKGQQLHLMGITERSVAYAAQALDNVVMTDEGVVTTHPLVVRNLLDTAGINVSGLNAYLAVGVVDGTGPMLAWVVLRRLDDLALVLTQLGYDPTVLLAYIASTQWQPCGPPHAAFVQLMADEAPEWINAWA